MKMNDEIFEDQVNPMHKQSGGALLSDAEFYLEEHKMRGSHAAGFSAFTSPDRAKKHVNKIHPGTLNQSVDGGLFNLHTIGIRPHQSPGEQGYIGELNNHPQASDRHRLVGTSVHYDSTRPMHFDERQELIIERIADQSLEVLEHPQPAREERKHDLNEEEKLMDEICKEQEESSRHPPARSSFVGASQVAGPQ